MYRGNCISALKNIMIWITIATVFDISAIIASYCNIAHAVE